MRNLNLKLHTVEILVLTAFLAFLSLNSLLYVVVTGFVILPLLQAIIAFYFFFKLVLIMIAVSSNR